MQNWAETIFVDGQAQKGWKAAAELGEVLASEDSTRHRLDGELAVCPETGYSDSVCRRIAVMSTAITALGAFLFNINCFTPVWLVRPQATMACSPTSLIAAFGTSTWFMPMHLHMHRQDQTSHPGIVNLPVNERLCARTTMSYCQC